MADLALDDVTVEIGGLQILTRVSMSVPSGQVVGIVGPSGSGKTTLLRTVGGLQRPSSGRVVIDDADVTAVPPAGRDVSMVFQNPALLPRRSVTRNVAFPLEVHGMNRDEVDERVGAELRAQHVGHLASRRPGTLSRGEEQMVQIARSLVRTPKVLLLDEPFTELDEQRRQTMRSEFATLQRGYGVTTLMTTNDPVDAMSLPAWIVVLEDGRVTQAGTPMEVHTSPLTLDAARSTGPLTTIDAIVRRADAGFWLIAEDRAGVEVVRMRVWSPALADRVGESVVIGLRPYQVVEREGGTMTGIIRRVVPGSAPEMHIDVGGQLVVIGNPLRSWRRGQTVHFDVDRAIIADPTSGHVICTTGAPP